MKRILLVKTSSLGDVIHNLPVVNDILKHYPDAEIDWVVEESFSDIPPLHPQVKQVFKVAMRRWRKQLFSKTTWQEVSAFKQAVASKQYDWIIDTQGLLKSALISRYAQGERYGMNKQSAREPIASHFYNHHFNIAKDQHAVVRNRELVACALGYAKPESLPDYGIRAQVDAPINLPKDFVIGLHGTSRDSKLWPTDHWQALAKVLANKQQSLLLPWVSDAEKRRAEAIAAASDNVIVLPKLSIAALATIIEKAALAIGVDTGLSHLATALNTPTIALYTDTDPALTGVHAGAVSAAVNLGGKNQIPSVTNVAQTIQSLVS